jgi:tRNA G18 (ribose-2'-O)-methylase SpoU
MVHMKESVLILLNIRSAENVGAIFRTADAVGIQKIFLVGTTPAPIDRFGRSRKDIAKAALGAEKTIEWEHLKTASAMLRKLRKEDFYIVAIEQSPKAIDYKKVKTQSKTTFIVGNEVSGIPKNILESADVIAEIPQRGIKESLNVATATGIALFRILNI